MNFNSKNLLSALIIGIALGFGTGLYDYFTSDEFDLKKIFFISAFSFVGLLIFDSIRNKKSQ